MCETIIEGSNSIKEAGPELLEEAKKVLNRYIENGVEAVSIYGICAVFRLGANKQEFKVS